MKVAALIDAVTATALQTAWLSEALAPVSEPGRRAEEALRPFRPGEEDAARERAERIARFGARIDAKRVDTMREALRTAPDPLPAISRAAMGDVLDDAQFLELQRFLDAAARIDALLEGERPPLVDRACAAVAQILERGRAGKFGFYLADSFDQELMSARANADRAQAEYDSARGRLGERAAQALGRDEPPAGEFIVMRESVAQVPQGVRVVREAPTYYLCELELDAPAVEALERRDAAAARVAAAEQNVRVRLTQHVRDAVQALETLAVRAGELDIVLAHARFAQRYDCVPATIAPSAGITFTEGRYLPLKAELDAQGRRYEAISLDLRDVAVLTGPNMGGKSVALRTAGFIALLAAFGIPVPAQSATLCLFGEIAWLGIGASDGGGGLLSSFAREVVRLKDILSRDSECMLVLVDEFARTTTPYEGKALLVALIRVLRRRGRVAFIATHLAGIARDARVRHFAVRGLRNVPRARSGDLDAALTALADSMDYAVVEVGEGAERHADAIALAHLLGLDEEIVAEAGTVLAEETGMSWIR